MQRVLYSVFFFAAALSMTSISLFFHRVSRMQGPDSKMAGLFSQNSYFGPTEAVPGNPHLVKVEVLVYDDASPAGVQIQEASFNGQNIPLKPRDIHGFRGSGSFQVDPGTYRLEWVVRRDKVVWPRTFAREEMVTVDSRDLWVQIAVEGETASIR